MASFTWHHSVSHKCSNIWYDDVIIPSTPTPPTSTRQLFFRFHYLSKIFIVFGYFFSLFSIWFFSFWPGGQISSRPVWASGRLRMYETPLSPEHRCRGRGQTPLYGGDKSVHISPTPRQLFASYLPPRRKSRGQMLPEVSRYGATAISPISWPPTLSRSPISCIQKQQFVPFLSPFKTWGWGADNPLWRCGVTAILLISPAPRRSPRSPKQRQQLATFLLPGSDYNYYWGGGNSNSLK